MPCLPTSPFRPIRRPASAAISNGNRAMSRSTSEGRRQNEECRMNLGIEIGGTKLQLVLGDAAGKICARRKLAVDRATGAAGIRQLVEWGVGRGSCRGREEV